jgi:hypothetical protein
MIDVYDGQNLIFLHCDGALMGALKGHGILHHTAQKALG